MINMIKANDFMYRFQTISFLIGVFRFTLMGIIFTAFITYFGIWSLRKFYVRFHAA